MKGSFLGKANLAQRKLLWVLLGMVVAGFIYAYGMVPLGQAKKRADEERELSQKLLSKYAEILQDRKSTEEHLERKLKQKEEIVKRLLPGETPQLAAAALQDIVRRLAEKNNVSLRSFRILEPKDVGFYRRIPLQIEINPVSSVASLTQFFYDLEKQDKDLSILEMDLLVFNPRMPNNIQGSVVVSGFMQGSKSKEKGKER